MKNDFLKQKNLKCHLENRKNSPKNFPRSHIKEGKY